MISGSAWSELPLCDIDPADDVSEPNPLTDLLSDPRAELAFMLIGNPFDPQLGTTRQVRASSHGYAALDDGGGAGASVADHAHFPAILASPYSVKVSLLSGGAWQASAVPGYGGVVFANPDGLYDEITLLDWEDSTVTVWMGRYQWIGPSFRKLGRVFTGVVDSMTWTTSEITLNVRDLKALLDNNVNQETYLGFGTAARMRAPGDTVSVPYGSWMRPTDADSNPIVSCEVMIKPRVAQDAIIVTQGGDLGWAMWIHADGALAFYDRGVTNFVRSPAGKVRVGVPTRVACYASSEGLAVRVDGVVVASNSVPYGGPVVVADLVIGGPG